MYYIGVDLGGTNIACGLVDEDCNIILKKSVPTRAERGEKPVVDDIIGVVMSVCSEYGISIQSEIIGIGIGSPGAVDTRGAGKVVFAGNVPFKNTPVGDMVMEACKVPVRMGNDANCAALGEVWAGRAKDCADVVMVTLGTGVGGGIIINRKIYSGFNDCAAEIGHIVIEVDGRQCTCGRRGCWEAYASATGLIKTTREVMQNYPGSIMWKMCENDLNKLSGRTSYKAMREGDAAGREVVEIYTKYLAAGIVDMINIFQPEMLLIGGGISNEGDALLVPLMEHVRRDRFSRDVPQTRIERATLGNDAGIIGAAMLGR